jgi:hypothetical protein
VKRNPGPASPPFPDFAAAQSGLHAELEPLLDLTTRLGEAPGAATALLILRAAPARHTGMVTFAKGGVSDNLADEGAEPNAAEQFWAWCDQLATPSITFPKIL